MGRLKTVLVFGTFDAMHPGHRYFLLRAKALADRLVVSLARDDFVRAFKGKVPRQDENERSARLTASGLADRVYLSDPVPGSYDILSRVKPNFICLGYDQDSLEESLQNWLQNRRWQIPLVKLEFNPRGCTDDSAEENPRYAASGRGQEP